MFNRKHEAPKIGVDCNHVSAGFSLIAVSIILTVAGILLVSTLPDKEASNNYDRHAMTSIEKLQKVEEAMKSFMASKGRRPCPADGQYATNTPNFGIEAANPGSCTGGVPAAPLGPDANTTLCNGAGCVVGGVLPTTTLGLSDDYAFDDWGRRFTYVVDTRATSLGTCITLETASATSTGKGGVIIHDGTGLVTDNVMYAYISHGPDGHGAWTSYNSRINSGTSDQDTLTNASQNPDYSTNLTNVRIKKELTPTFDDVTYYADYLKNTCCVGKVCIPLGFRVDGTSANQNLRILGTIDINGDGIQDLVLIGNNQGTGQYDIFVLFGQLNRAAFQQSFSLASIGNLAPPYGFTIQGLGALVNGGVTMAVGDFNGDGIPDLLLVGSGTNCGWGSINVIFGQKTSWPASINLSSLSNTSSPQGMKIGNFTGCPSTSTGNVHGSMNSIHKIDDIILGDSFNGIVDVIFGQPAGSWPSYFDANSLNGVNGAQIVGYLPGQAYTGSALSTANLQGRSNIKDLVIGAADLSQGYRSRGYVIWGQTGAWTSPLSLSALPANGSLGFEINNAGSGISGYFAGGLAAGDITGDGVDDVVIGSPNGSLTTGGAGGTVTGIFGHASGWTSNVYDISHIDGTGATGTRLQGNWGASYINFTGVAGYSVINIADINNDGIGDVITNDTSGHYFVFYGHTPPWSSYASPLDPTTFNSNNGFVFSLLNNSIYPPTAVTGDMDKDGIKDVIFADPTANSNTGAVYIVRGQPIGQIPSALSPSTLINHGYEIDGALAGDRAGSALVTGNFDNTQSDLAIAAPGRSPNGVSGAGSVYVIYNQKANNWISPLNLSRVAP